MSHSTIGGIQLESSHALDLKSVLAKKGLLPADEWMLSFLATQRITTPGSALASTATFRLLAANITDTLNKSVTLKLPPDIQDSSIKERRLPEGSLIVQVLDVEDIGRSRWEQVEALEAIQRGEGTKGKELFRLEDADEGGSEQEHGSTLRSSTVTASSASKSKGPHKILMQDVAGTVAFGIEVEKIEGISLNMSLGSKMMLHGSLVSRGIVLLEPSTAALLGGKIEALHHSWHQMKKDKLSAAIEDQAEAS